MNMKPVFSFSIDMKLSDATVGKYDSIHSSLTAITQGNKVIIHSPHVRYNLFNSQKTWSEIKNDVGVLSINQTVTAICTGKLSDNSKKEYLAIGTESNILVYQVDDNLEIFYKEIPEGVRCMLIGSIDAVLGPMLLVGSNTTVRGLNDKGDEIFWIVTTGNVNTMILFDFNRDNEHEILLGCEDHKIKIYKNDKFLRDLNENASVMKIASIGPLLISFILKNGTIGVYEEHVRLWRIKSKTCATAMECYDLLGTGQVQMITGWDNGKIDVRDPRSGDVLLKLSAPNKVIGLLVTDYRGSGLSDLVCVTEHGEVQGYSSSNVNLAPLTVLESSQIKDLLNLKQNLMLEMTHYENNTRVNESLMNVDDSVATMNQLKTISDDFAIIPANTRLQIAISTSIDTVKHSSVEVSISTNNSTIIKAVIIFADGIFKDSETLIIHPPTKRASSGYGMMNNANSRDSSGVSNIVIPLKIEKDEIYDVHIKAFVGNADGNQFHVFELNRQLPKFAMYALPERITGSPKTLNYMTNLSNQQLNGTIPEGYVKFKVNERINRFCLWINQNFLLPADIDPQTNELENFDFFKLSLICLRDKTPLVLTFYNDNHIQIQTDNIELAGNLVQSMAQFMNIVNLDSVANYPVTVNKMRELFDKLNGMQESSNILRTDTSLKVNLAKKLIIRAEDSKTTNLDKVANYYNELMLNNEDLMSTFKIRTENFNETQKLLTEINQILYRAQRLRVGTIATQMMASYKEALAQKDLSKLIQIMEING